MLDFAMVEIMNVDILTLLTLSLLSLSLEDCSSVSFHYSLADLSLATSLKWDMESP